MDKTKLIETIKNQLKQLVSSEVKFAEIKAGDLIISSPDEVLAVGSEVYVSDEAGNNIPLSDGEYTLDSGEKITVTNGKVDAISASEEVEAPEEVEVESAEKPAEEAPKEEEKKDEPMGEKLPEEKLNALEKRIAECEKMLAKMTEDNSKMAQALSKVAELPSKESISNQPSEFKSVEEKKNSSFGIESIVAIREKARKNR